MSLDRIGAAWREYRLLVIPRDAPPVQAMECRRAFYAGVKALLAIQVATEDSDAAVAKLLDDLHGELDAFKVAVVEGRA